MTALLLVEDDLRISEPLLRVLRGEGFEVDHVTEGQAALDHVAASTPDLVLLDLTLPDLDGLDVCRKLRGDHETLPIIMLTARAEEVDVIVGLNAGADDYVAKPFRLAELVARIRARLRVTATTSEAARSETLEGHGIRLDLAARRCFLTPSAVADVASHSSQPGAAGGLQTDAAATTDVEVELTTKEFDLLALLMSQPGTTFRRDDIMTAVWDEHWWGSTRTLDTHVSTLRKKLDDTTDPPTKIVTVRGVGFRFEP